MNEGLLRVLADKISQTTQQAFQVKFASHCSGGCINQAFLLEGASQQYFVKTNRADILDMFIAESQALDEIIASEAICAPKPICYGTYERSAFLILERVHFEPPSPDSWEQMGRQLAALHQHTKSQFGWQRDNAIGSTPQRNPKSNNWADFFTQQRIEFQLKLAESQGIFFQNTNALLDHVHQVLHLHRPQASLLHGDLWSGNVSFTNAQEPVIFDPASYYGDRETDLAFTELFGAFPECFYRSYQEEWPLPEGHMERKRIYNLYHVLNHANLFGGSYPQQAQSIIDQVHK